MGLTTNEILGLLQGAYVDTPYQDLAALVHTFAGGELRGIALLPITLMSGLYGPHELPHGCRIRSAGGWRSSAQK